MTKRAQAINGFIQTLTDFGMDSMAIRLALRGGHSTLTIREGKEHLDAYQMQMKSHLANILESNPEQAEALMNELGVKWKNDKPPYK
jgi:hypothetical protein